MNMSRGTRVRVCECVCMCSQVCMSVIIEIHHPFQDNVISINTYTLYTRRISIIYVMIDYLFVLICARDVASHGASGCVI